jgi:biotin carboxyl carrier protein
MKYAAIVDGQRVDIEFERKDNGQIHARVSDRVYQLQASNVGVGVYWFNWNNRSIEIALTPSDNLYNVSVGHYRTSLEILDARTALRKAAHQAHDGIVELKAPMPGKIVKVLVTEGAQVKPNQGVLVMEAMKMQNELKSPKGGTVRKLNVTEGVAVNSGQVLAIVE